MSGELSSVSPVWNTCDEPSRRKVNGSSDAMPCNLNVLEPSRRVPVPMNQF